MSVLIPAAVWNITQRVGVRCGLQRPLPGTVECVFDEVVIITELDGASMRHVNQGIHIHSDGIVREKPLSPGRHRGEQENDDEEKRLRRHG
jgi:hypothetical protein